MVISVKGHLQFTGKASQAVKDIRNFEPNSRVDLEFPFLITGVDNNALLLQVHNYILPNDSFSW